MSFKRSSDLLVGFVAGSQHEGKEGKKGDGRKRKGNRIRSGLKRGNGVGQKGKGGESGGKKGK